MKDRTAKLYAMRVPPISAKGGVMAEKSSKQPHIDVAIEIRRLQHHAAMARGEQAYRELSRYVVLKCAEILKAMEDRE